MSEWNTEELIDIDKRSVWHPFTNMREWCAPEHEPLVLVEGRGALLRDSRGREIRENISSLHSRAVTTGIRRARPASALRRCSISDPVTGISPQFKFLM